MGGTERRTVATRCLLMAETSLYEKNLLFFTAAYPPVADTVRVRETELTDPLANARINLQKRLAY